MTQLLDEKIVELRQARDYSSWYIVKQDTNFISQCYQVSFLHEYQLMKDPDDSLEKYIADRAKEINDYKSLSISLTHRALRVPVFLGLIKMKSSQFKDAILSETFHEIKALCDGNFEKLHLYSHVIKRQIEKMFLSSEIDEQHDDIRREYRLYPILLLYKILIELGGATGKYRITIPEYRYFVATTKLFKDYLDTLLLIQSLRLNDSYIRSFSEYEEKFDNRMVQILKQLDTLEVTDTYIQIKNGYELEVFEKLSAYEINTDLFETENYIEFLCSTASLFDLPSIKQKRRIEAKSDRLEGGRNILIYGVPGSGKSHTIREEYCKDLARAERIVFHPDYMNADFVGQILPTIDEFGRISYIFHPGPFTRVLEKAYEDKNQMYYLIIEEINRGNAPAIFGELFQLLDREPNGASTYEINNQDIARIVFQDPSVPIRIPSNLMILATMNTADQNVFTLDTAFQRRWDMRMIKNDVAKAKHAGHKILDTEVTWGDFNKVINDQILNERSLALSSEDKRLGAYFITEYELEEMTPWTFAEKIIKYLWDDAFKFARGIIFNQRYKSLEQTIAHFVESKGKNRFDIFSETIKSQLTQEGIPAAPGDINDDI